MEDSSSISKLNSTSYTYLGRADLITSTSGLAPSSIDLSRAPTVQKISRPIAGELPQDDKKLSNIIGKNFSNTNHPTTLHITLEDLLPPVQQAPKNSSGEFIVKLQMSNIQISNSNIIFKHQIQIQISNSISHCSYTFQIMSTNSNLIHWSGSSQHCRPSLIRLIRLQMLRVSSLS